MRTATLIGIGLALALASAAYGSDVGTSGKKVMFSAAAGEANRVVVRGESGALRITDRGAVLEAAGGCVQLDEHRATCAGRRVAADLGDGDDVFNGSSEGDRVHGRDGADTISGGKGFDYLIDASRDDDELSGGPGFNVVVAFRGKDTVRGGPYFDVLVAPSPGARVFGGGGFDRLGVSPRAAHINCGQGSDVINPLGLMTVIPRSCESFEFEQLEESVKASVHRVSADVLRVPVPDLCGTLEAPDAERCAVHVQLLRDGQRLGHAVTADGVVNVELTVPATRLRSVAIRYHAPKAEQVLEVRLPVSKDPDLKR